MSVRAKLGLTLAVLVLTLMAVLYVTFQADQSQRFVPGAGLMLIIGIGLMGGLAVYMLQDRSRRQASEERFHAFMQQSLEGVAQMDRSIEADLRHRMAAEELLAEISARFIHVSADGVEAEMQAALRTLGEFTGVDRAYVFKLIDVARMDNTHEWCAPGIEPQIDNLKGLSTELFPWWMARLHRHESIHIPRVADLPSEAAAEKDLLQQQAVQSVVVVPMIESQQLIGFVRFDSVRGEKSWPEADVRLLQIVAETFVNALARQRTEREIRALNESLEQRIRERTRQLEAANQELGREVFERARAEMALRDSESFYHSLAEVLPMPLCRKDLAGRFTFGNRLYCEGIHLTLSELIGKTDFDLHPAELAEKYRRDDQQVIESGQVFETVEEHQTLGGHKSYVQVVKAPIRTPQGQIVGIQIMFWDVTDRWRAEEVLRQSEARLRQIIDLVPHFIFAKDIDGKFLLVNQAVAEAYGTTVEALLSRTDADFARSPDEARRFREADLAVIDSQSPKTISEEPMTDAHGQVRILHTTKIPVNFSGTATPAVLGVSVDITERLKAEAALRASEERFRQIAENMHEVFWMAALNPLRMLYVSPVYEDIWGRSCESLYADPASIVETVYADDLPGVTAFADRMRRGQVGFVESRIERPDGSIGWVWVRAFPIRNAQGEIDRVAGIAEDVTERKQAEEELRRALAQEKELSDLKSRFISMASHDFRTPLTTILSSTDLLDRYGHRLTDERKHQHLQQIQASVKHMTGLLEDVLIIGRADAGKLEYQPAPLDVHQFCCQLVEELQLSAGTKHILRIITDEPGRPAMLDVKLLRQILTNLLSNAIKYSPNGGAVTLTVKHESDAVVFQVIDHGLGIPVAAQPRLFETFHRADNVGSIPGTGLGMAIVKKSVDLQRGTIEFESTVGVGTTFTVRLPDAALIGQSAD